MVYTFLELTSSIVANVIPTKLFRRFKNLIKVTSHQPGIIRIVSNKVKSHLKLAPEVFHFIKNIASIVALKNSKIKSY